MRVAIIAGEPSGDMLGSMLMQELQLQFGGSIEFMGIGGAMMAHEGLVSSFDINILSIGGIGFDVLLSIPRIYLMYRAIVKKIIAFKPDVFIGVDAPDFNLHVEKKLKECGIKTVHYISPTIWAWRYERIHSIKKSTDLMLCIFPMEEALYAEENIKAVFVGHHLADQIEKDIDTAFYRKKIYSSTSSIFATNYFPSSEAPSSEDLSLEAIMSGTLITILVGSRISELKRLAPEFIEACNLIAQKIPNVFFLFPLLDNKAASFIEQMFAQVSINFHYRILVNQTSDAIKSADIVLAKSGTVTLEVALCKKPLVISYKVSKLSEWYIRKKIKIKYVGQPNILLQEEVAKELLQSHVNATELAGAVLELYYDKTKQQQMIAKFYQLHDMLRQGASHKAAQSILQFLHLK